MATGDVAVSLPGVESATAGSASPQRYLHGKKLLKALAEVQNSVHATLARLDDGGEGKAE